MNEPQPAGGPRDDSTDDGVSISDEQDVPLDTGRLAVVAAAALRALNTPAGARLDVTLVDAARMVELKERALGIRAPTDVLSFPMDALHDPMPGPLHLGDVVICPAVAARQARALGRGIDDEMAQLAVHGILHLLGRDHQDLRAEHAMAAEERRVLAEAAR